MASKDRLAEIKARAERATPGPWEYDGKFRVGINHSESWTGFRTAKEDAAFIAHAREDIPWLIAEVERLRTETVPEVLGYLCPKCGTLSEGMECKRCTGQAELDRLRAENNKLKAALFKIANGGLPFGELGTCEERMLAMSRIALNALADGEKARED